MKIKEVERQPKEGQFVVMWIWQGEVFSATCRYNKRGYVERFLEDLDGWETGYGFPKTDIRWFVVGDGK